MHQQEKMDLSSKTLILTLDSKYFNLNFVGINTVWFITPKILTLIWSVCSVTSLRALWNHGGVVYSLDGCQTGEQEEGFNKSFLTLTLQKQIPMSICVSSAASACAHTAGQNSHCYLSVTSFANKSYSSAFPDKVNGTGRDEGKRTLFIQATVSVSLVNMHETFITDFGVDKKRKESMQWIRQWNIIIICVNKQNVPNVQHLASILFVSAIFSVISTYATTFSLQFVV